MGMMLFQKTGFRPTAWSEDTYFYHCVARGLSGCVGRCHSSARHLLWDSVSSGNCLPNARLPARNCRQRCCLYRLLSHCSDQVSDHAVFLKILAWEIKKGLEGWTLSVTAKRSAGGLLPSPWMCRLVLPGATLGSGLPFGFLRGKSVSDQWSVGLTAQQR